MQTNGGIINYNQNPVFLVELKSGLRGYIVQAYGLIRVLEEHEDIYSVKIFKPKQKRFVNCANGQIRRLYKNISPTPEILKIHLYFKQGEAEKN